MSRLVKLGLPARDADSTDCTPHGRREAGSGHGRRCGAVIAQLRTTDSCVDLSLNYTVFYFPQSYFTPSAAILTAFLDFSVAIAQIVTKSIKYFPCNHGCFEKSDGACAVRQRRRRAYNGRAVVQRGQTGQNCDASTWNVVKFLAIDGSA